MISMRKFSSYGPINTKLHYYVPRTALIEQALTQLVGLTPDEGGHYITVWAPRQRGKTWIMQQTFSQLQTDPQYDRFEVAVLNLEHLKTQTDIAYIVQSIAQDLIEKLGLADRPVKTLDQFYHIFKKGVLKKPLILILDEFDALAEEAISGLAGVFRNIYIGRQYQANQSTEEKDYLLHGVALIGVRSVLGIENVTGSPFNVQRSLHIPNLTLAEVEAMFRWYEQEWGQTVEQAVIEQVFDETQGQPGLTSWLGELLTETYNQNPEQPLTMTVFERAYKAAIRVLPNSNILNIISKAKQAPYQQAVLEMFRTTEKLLFTYDDPLFNFLYMNGVIDQEEEAGEYYAKFSSPFVQKRLFNYFSRTLFRDVGQLHPPFEALEDTITAEHLNVPNLIRRYEAYLRQNQAWLFKDVPRKANLRPYEATYHFNLYMYLIQFLQHRGGQVFPEFPTGNGKIDLIIRYGGQVYGLELKSFVDTFSYKQALNQAAQYGQKLGTGEISLIFFVEVIDTTSRTTYEVVYIDEATGTRVRPIFVATGE